jgi:hypothetical protein
MMPLKALFSVILNLPYYFSPSSSRTSIFGLLSGEAGDLTNEYLRWPYYLNAAPHGILSCGARVCRCLINSGGK